MEKNLQNLSKNSSIKRVILIFFSITAASILLSCECDYEFCHSFFNQFQSIKNSISKKVILCFFNGILIFLAKDFVFLALSTEQPITATQRGEEFADQKGEHQQLMSGKEVVVAKRVEKMETALIEDDESDEEKEQLSIDELNRIFEEFIERVKRERKSESLADSRVCSFF